MPTYLGPSIDLTLADGTVVHPGDECDLDAATQATLEKAGLYFSDTAATPAPQSASENLASSVTSATQEGTTATAQAQASGLSVGSQTAPPPAPAAPPPVPPVPAPPATPPAPPPVPPVPPVPAPTPPATPKPPAS